MRSARPNLWLRMLTAVPVRASVSHSTLELLSLVVSNTTKVSQESAIEACTLLQGTVDASSWAELTYTALCQAVQITSLVFVQALIECRACQGLTSEIGILKLAVGVCQKHKAQLRDLQVLESRKPFLDRFEPSIRNMVHDARLINDMLSLTLFSASGALNSTPHPGLTLTVAKIPAQKLVFSNCVFVSFGDMLHLCSSQAETAVKDEAHVEIGGRIFTAEPHDELQAGSIAFNQVQREYAQLALCDKVLVKRITPPKKIGLAICVLEIDVLYPRSSTVSIHEAFLRAVFRQMIGQIVAVGQPIVLERDRNLLQYVVLDVAPNESMDTLATGDSLRGMVGSDTRIELRQGPSGSLRILRDASA